MDQYDDKKEEDDHCDPYSEDEEEPEVDREEVYDWGRRLDTYLYCLNGSALSASEKCERLEVLNHFMFEWDHRFVERGRVESLWNGFIVDFIDLMEIIQV